MANNTWTATFTAVNGEDFINSGTTNSRYSSGVALEEVEVLALMHCTKWFRKNGGSDGQTVTLGGLNKRLGKCTKCR